MSKNLAQVIADEAVLLVALQRRLFDAGLVASAAAINEATNKLGWEGARLLGRQEQIPLVDSYAEALGRARGNRNNAGL